MPGLTSKKLLYALGIGLAAGLNSGLLGVGAAASSCPAWWLSSAGDVGAVAGAVLALHLEHRRLRQVFAVYLLFVAAQTLRKAVRQKPKPA